MRLQNIEQVLADGKLAFIHTVGVSMEPMLHERESTVVLELPQGRLQRGDVVLFRRQNGQYVLHRIIRVRGGQAQGGQSYLIRGDNCLGHEAVPHAWIVGVMKGYYERTQSPYTPKDDPHYQRYVRTLGARHVLLRTRWLLGWPLRKLKKVMRPHR